MTSYEFEVAAKNAIVRFVEARYRETYRIQDINMVWFAHVLGHKKGIFIDNGENRRLYEVTYHSGKDEMYVDVYDKVINYVAEIDKEVKSE